MDALLLPRTDAGVAVQVLVLVVVAGAIGWRVRGNREVRLLVLGLAVLLLGLLGLRALH